MTSDSPPLDSSTDAELKEFTLWALAVLGIQADADESGVFTGAIPDGQQFFGEDDTLRIAFGSHASEDSTVRVTCESAFLRKLVSAIRMVQEVTDASAASQPESVREISTVLFDAYTVDDGSVHLSGCTLEDRAVLRVTYLEWSADAAAKLKHRFVNLNGQPLAHEVASGLELDRLIPSDKPMRVPQEQRQRWQSLGESVVAGLNDSAERELLLVTAVWCKFAEGKLEFAIGDSTASLTFSGWARMLVEGLAKPPPFASPEADERSYHITITDDGEIVPAEAVGKCSESGTRVLVSRLETCPATGRRALAKYFANCAITGQRVLRSALQVCEMCHQPAAPTAIKSKRCSACRSLRSVSKDDPRMARLLGEYPRLDRWRKWKLAETSTAYVLTASSLMKQLLIVADRDSLHVLRLATGSRLTHRWTAATDLEREEYLR